MTYTVTLQPSGHTYLCPAGTPLLQAGLDAGLAMPYSCRSGMCLTCRGKVTQGRVDFGDVHTRYLSDDDKQQGLALLCRATPLSDVEIQVDEPDPDSLIQPKFIPSRVLKTERPADDVMIVTLGLPVNEPMPFRAGQYLDVLLAGGARRSYSIASPPPSEGARQLELHIRRVPGGLFTEHVFGAMKLREILRLEMPLGSFFLREQSDKPIILLATGTGFAPIKSLVEHSLQRGLRRPIALYWGARRRTDLYQLELARSWAAAHPHIRFTPVLSAPTPECEWSGRTGHVQQAAIADFPDMTGHEVYACGLPAMVESARRDCAAQCGLPADAFFADAFLTEADRAQQSVAATG